MQVHWLYVGLAALAVYLSTRPRGRVDHGLDLHRAAGRECHLERQTNSEPPR